METLIHIIYRLLVVTVLSLPKRDGNRFWLPSFVAGFAVLSLPKRDGNKEPKAEITRPPTGSEPT